MCLHWINALLYRLQTLVYTTLMKIVLVIDDDPTLRSFLSRSLAKFDYEVVQAEDGKTGVEKAVLHSPDAILLDLKMPGMDGRDVCSLLKNNPKTANIPLIILTGEKEICDEVEGLKLGAEDYLVKPFDFKVMLARLDKAVERARELKKDIVGITRVPDDNILRVSKIALHLLSHTVSVDGQDVPLTPTEFRILAILMRNEGKVISRPELIDNVWEQKSGNMNRLADTHVNKIRKKLGPFKDYLQTRYGSGYCFRDSTPH